MVTTGRDVETRLIIEAQMKGAQRVVQDAQKLKTALGADKLAKGMKDFDKSLESVRKNLEGTVRQVKDFDSALKGLTGSGSALRTLTQLMNQFRQQAEAAAAATQQIGVPGGGGGGAPTPRAPRRRGGFFSSIFGAGRQGFTGGQQFGAGRPGAGAGGIARGFGRLFGGGGGGGAGGLSGARLAGGGALLAAGVAVGGAVGLSKLALQASDEALQSRILLQDLVGATAGGQLTRGAVDLQFRDAINRQELELNQQTLRQFRMQRRRLAEGGAFFGGGGLGGMSFTTTGGQTAGGTAATRRELNPRVQGLDRIIADLERSNEQTTKFLSPEFQRRRGYQTGQDRLRIIAQQAGPLGFTIPQAIGLQAQALTRAGVEAFTEPGLALQQQTLQAARLGIGPGVVGALGQGRRINAFAGEGGDLNRIMSEAVASGLNQAEVNRLLGEISQNVEVFRQTGVPIAGTSIIRLGQSLSLAGAGSVERGAAAGRQLTELFRNVAARGPQAGSRLDVQILRTLGGLGDNPSPDDLERARAQIESMVSDPAQSRELARRTRLLFTRLIRGAGGGAGGRQALQAELQARGVRFGAGEFRRIGQTVGMSDDEYFRFLAHVPEQERRFYGIRQAIGGRRTAQLEEQRIQLEQQRATAAGEDPRFTTILGARAGATVDVAARRAAEQTNQRIVSTANDVLNAAQSFADVQVAAVTGAANVFGEKLRILADTIADATDTIRDKIEDLTGTAVSE